MQENILDRGMKKWAGLMLPEHNVELKNWMDKEDYIERPELTEWDLQSIQEELEVACKRKCETRIRTWTKGRINQRLGRIAGIDLKSECILIDDPFGIDRIPVSGIIGVQCID